MSPLKDLAIQKALENNWQEAYNLNRKVLEENPNDVDTLNRLGFSLIKLCKFKKAKEIYKKVVLLDKTNPIAIKNLKKIEELTKQKLGKNSILNDMCSKIQELFIEEAGKTKIVELKNITDKKTLSLFQPGDKVYLIVKRSKIFVQANGKKYIGMLPDSVGMRLIPFMKGGNEYQAFIKSIDDKFAEVFIREIKQTRKFKNQPSFTYSPLYYQGAEEKNN